MNIINSTNNPKIKELVKLHKASQRKDRGVVLIDGEREIISAVKAKWEIITLFYCPELIAARAGKLNNFLGVSSENVVEVSRSVFDKICYKDKPDGFMAVAKQKNLSLDNISLSQAPLVVILEAVEKPGNLGAIIRSAYASEVDVVIVNDSQTDIYNPNTIRASEGLIFSQPMVVATLAETRQWLKKNRITSFAASTSAKQNYWQANFQKGVAIVLGSEADGLSKEWLVGADHTLKIPMRSEVDSLNVSVSAALVIYEVLRQRHK
jgi:TrmH family RNA methyltransferase